MTSNSKNLSEVPLQCPDDSFGQVSPDIVTLELAKTLNILCTTALNFIIHRLYTSVLFWNDNHNVYISIIERTVSQN